MTTRFLDTNIVLRHLTKDDPQKARACFALIEAIRDILLPLISLPGLKLPHKRMYARVFELYTSLPIDYVDAYHAALMENRGEPEVYSYDTDFDRIAGITRLEP